MKPLTVDKCKHRRDCYSYKKGGTECKYKPLEIPTKTILEMVKNGTWEGSLEQEEIEYNVEHKLYAVKQFKQYSNLLAKIKENKYAND